MNILICGANGQLGTSIIDNISKETNNIYYFTDVNGKYDYLDITKESDVIEYSIKNNIKCAINCAAYTNVDMAEDNFEKANMLNAVGVRNLAKAMNRMNGTLIHISTDYVYGSDSSNTPISETQEPKPCSIYGKTKLLGENAIKEENCRHIIIRTAWLYSLKSETSFPNKILNLAKKNKELKVVFDQCGTPTNSNDLANAILDIVENNKIDGNEGIYNFTNEGVCSWYDFAHAVIKLSTVNCNIVPCHSSEFKAKATRPSYSVLDKTKFKETFEINIPNWADSLEKEFFGNASLKRLAFYKKHNLI